MSIWSFNSELLHNLADVLEMTVTEIAKRCNLKPQTLNRYVKGEYVLPLQTLIQMCNTLCMPISLFILKIGEQKNPKCENITIPQDIWQPIDWDAKAVDTKFGDGTGRICWKDVAEVMGVTSQKPHPRFLLQTKFPITDFLSVCSKLDISPYIFLVDQNLPSMSEHGIDSLNSQKGKFDNDESFNNELARLRADMDRLQRDFEDLTKKYTALLQHQGKKMSQIVNAEKL